MARSFRGFAAQRPRVVVVLAEESGPLLAARVDRIPGARVDRGRAARVDPSLVARVGLGRTREPYRRKIPATAGVGAGAKRKSPKAKRNTKPKAAKKLTSAKYRKQITNKTTRSKASNAVVLVSHLK